MMCHSNARDEIAFSSSIAFIFVQIILIKNDIPRVNFELPTFFSFNLKLNSTRSAMLLHQLGDVIDETYIQRIIDGRLGLHLARLIDIFESK